ncbi:MAG: histone deacetylase [Pelagibacteraceae bacterium]|nr:MAG: histone deacetylase [Pelagibacteraceae bacterium]
MKKLNVVYNDNYDIPLPEGHRFVGTKFSDLYNFIKNSNLYTNLTIHQSKSAPINDVQVVHNRDYVMSVKEGNLSRDQERRINLPWSEKLAKRSFLAIQGTLQTSQLALDYGIACHLAGGTHHAFKDCGSGFCVFNDLAYASITLLNQKKINKILILDLDVHQGDGTASICENIDNIFTCSIHCKNNFPFDKKNSNLDVPIDDEVDDVKYINILTKTLDQIESNFTPDIVFYDAGVDVHSNDDLGNLNLTDDGIKKRDEIVCEYFKEKKIPLCTVIGGGYSKNRQELASRHFSIFETVSKTYL